MMEWWKPWSWTAETWSALATTATFLTAAAAAVFAGFQVREARRTREDQAQPFVVVDFEPSPAWAGLMEITIRNIGSTVAKDVRITFDPPLASVDLDKRKGWPGFQELSILKHGIPSLPPGKAHRIFFDRMPDRIKSDLPRKYVATVELAGPRHKIDPQTYVLDLDVYSGYRFMTIYGEHDAVKALREIEKTVKRWTAHFNGLRVYAVDEDRRREAERRELIEARAAFEADRIAETASVQDPASSFEAHVPIPMERAEREPDGEPATDPDGPPSS